MPRVGPAAISRLWLGAPLPAAAGRATAAKLQTYWGYKVIERPLSSCMRPPFKDKGQSVVDCSPRTRGWWGLPSLECATVDPARNTRAGSGNDVRDFPPIYTIWLSSSFMISNNDQSPKSAIHLGQTNAHYHDLNLYAKSEKTRFGYSIPAKIMTEVHSHLSGPSCHSAHFLADISSTLTA